MSKKKKKKKKKNGNGDVVKIEFFEIVLNHFLSLGYYILPSFFFYNTGRIICNNILLITIYLMIIYNDSFSFFSFSVFVMTAGLLIYPLGLPSEFFQHYCGESVGIFRSGYCQIGWSYMLAIMGVCLAIFCPVLSRHTDIKANDIGVSPDYI